MARQRSNRPSGHRVVTNYKDEQRAPLERFDYEERLVQQPDGTWIAEKVSSNIILSSGESFNPSMASGPRPPMPVGACALCGTTHSIFPWRRRRTTRLTSLQQLRHCVDCGAAVCPNHRKRGKDRRCRCPRCHRRYLAKRFLRPIFYKEELVE